MEAEEGDGLSLQSLAQRLERLERENAELREEVAELRGSETPREGEAPASEELAGRVVSRRSLLSKAGAAAVAAMAAGALTQRDIRQAKAHQLDPEIRVDRVWTHYVISEPHGDSYAVDGRNFSTRFAAVFGRNGGSGPGITGINTAGGTGVEGSSLQRNGTGVRGEGGTGGTGVLGKGVIGVRGHSSTAGQAGVYGENTAGKGPGVVGRGVIGVRGRSSTAGQAGVYGENTTTGNGPGVVGDGKGSDVAGVLGRNPTSGGYGVRGNGGTGVYGSSRFGVGVKGELTEGDGVGVFAKSSTDKGLGGWFEGGRAQLRIKPKSSAGKPTGGEHAQGELYMDSQAELFVCTAAGGPGTWRRVQTVAT
jgi:hypothetical protein